MNAKMLAELNSCRCVVTAISAIHDLQVDVSATTDKLVSMFDINVKQCIAQCYYDGASVMKSGVSRLLYQDAFTFTAMTID